MKKLMTTMLLLATIMPVSAQIVKSRTFGEKKKNPITWYARAGVSINGLVGPGAGEIKKVMKEEKEESAEYGGIFKGGLGYRGGYDFEVGFRKNFGASNVYWGMELGFGTRGGRFSASWTDDEDSDMYEKLKSTASSYTIKYMPFQIGYLYPVNDQLSLDAHLGVYASYDLSHKVMTKESSTTSGELREEEENDTDYADMNGFDAGLKLGVGVWYGRFNFDVSWQRGFATYMGSFLEEMNDHNKNIYSNNFILSVGVSF